MQSTDRDREEGSTERTNSDEGNPVAEMGSVALELTSRNVVTPRSIG